MSQNQKPNETNFMKFYGGFNLIFVLVALLLIALLIFVLSSISFIFQPLLVLITSVMTPMLLAVIFYYMFVPLVDLLEKHNVSRSLGATIALVLLILLTIVSIGLAIPVVIKQITAFAYAVPGIVENFVNVLQNQAESSELQQYYAHIIDWVNSSLTDIAQQLLNTLGSTLQGLTSIISAISGFLLSLMTFPIFLYFLLLDGRHFKNQFLKIFPSGARDEINQLTHDINFQVGAYIKGRLLVSLFIGIFHFIGFSIIGLNYAFVLALLAGILSLIPYIGPFLTLVPTVIVALSQSVLITGGALLVWAISQVLDGNILGPSIIGKNLSMHPLTIMIVLIGAGSVLGVSGMIVGIPLYAIIKVIVTFFFQLFKKRYVLFFDKNQY